MFKETVQRAVAEIFEGMREWLQLYIALIAAPFVVCKEFIAGTGRWAQRVDTRADSAGDQRRV